MLKLIKKNQKKVMAIVSVGLMIAWALPTSRIDPGSPNTKRGSIGKEALTQGEIANAAAEWDILRDRIAVRFGSNRFEPAANILADGLPGQESNRYDDYIYGLAEMKRQINAGIAREIDNHDDMFALLIHEARALGATFSQDDFRGVVQNMRYGAKVDPDFAGQAIADLLLVQNAFARTADTIKITQPWINRELGKEQEMSVHLVEFDDSTYLPNTSRPTADEIDKQYTKYCRTDPDSNAMHFGYQLPDRVKFQYLEIPRQAVEDAVAAQITRADELLYYYQHKDRYRSPDAHAALTLSPVPLPATGPSTRPFEEVRPEVSQDLKTQRADELTQSILSELTTKLQTDYLAWKASLDKQLGSSADEHPKAIADDLAARLPPYGSYSYLQAQAASIQQNYHVLPIVASVARFQNERQILAAQKPPLLPGPSSLPAATPTAAFPATAPATAPTTAATTAPALLLSALQAPPAPEPSLVPADLANAKVDTGNPYDSVRFPTYATHLVNPIANDQTARTSHVRILNLEEPSVVLKDAHNNCWLFRITEIATSVKQEKLDVEQHIEDDCRRIQAHEMALADAKEFSAQALKLGFQNAASAVSATQPSATQASATQVSATQAAATQPSYTIFHTGHFGFYSAGPEQLAPYRLPDDTQRQKFAQQAMDLLTTPCPRDPAHPVGIVDLPEAQRVDVVQLDDLVPLWTAKDVGQQQWSIQTQLQRTQSFAVAEYWFSYNKLTARLNYVPVNAKKN